MKFGQNQVLIRQDFGVDGYYGKTQQLKKVMKILNENLIYNYYKIIIYIIIYEFIML